jgi:hypothetical protein
MIANFVCFCSIRSALTSGRKVVTSLPSNNGFVNIAHRTVGEIRFNRCDAEDTPYVDQLFACAGMLVMFGQARDEVGSSVVRYDGWQCLITHARAHTHTHTQIHTTHQCYINSNFLDTFPVHPRLSLFLYTLLLSFHISLSRLAHGSLCH